MKDEQLRRRMVPPGTSILRLTTHLFGGENWWFVINFLETGEAPLWSTDEDPDADMRAEEGETTAALIEMFEEACERSRKIVESTESRAVAVLNARRGQVDLRWMLIHMI